MTKKRRVQMTTKDVMRLGGLAYLDKMADIVLAYLPKARSKPAVQRKRRRTILQNKRAKEKP